MHEMIEEAKRIFNGKVLRVYTEEPKPEKKCYFCKESSFRKIQDCEDPTCESDHLICNFCRPER